MIVVIDVLMFAIFIMLFFCIILHIFLISYIVVLFGVFNIWCCFHPNSFLIPCYLLLGLFFMYFVVLKMGVLYLHVDIWLVIEQFHSAYSDILNNNSYLFL